MAERLAFADQITELNEVIERLGEEIEWRKGVMEDYEGRSSEFTARAPIATALRSVGFSERVAAAVDEAHRAPGRRDTDRLGCDGHPRWRRHRATVEKLVANTEPRYELIIVDNDSPDDTADRLTAA